MEPTKYAQAEWHTPSMRMMMSSVAKGCCHVELGPKLVM
jgi:hypothetical protein